MTWNQPFCERCLMGQHNAWKRKCVQADVFKQCSYPKALCGVWFGASCTAVYLTGEEVFGSWEKC